MDEKLLLLMRGQQHVRSSSPLARRAWDLRHAITFYDGLYVALAAQLDLPLLTADIRLSKVPGLSCRVMLIS